MKITENWNGDVLKIALEGRLDTGTAPLLEEKFKSCDKEIKGVILDFAKVDYISSAGLRVLLPINMKLTADGNDPVTIKNANEIVREVFEITGLSTILNIE